MECSDTINLATQLGRIDLASLLLSIMALLMALAGVYAFINIRSIAASKAKVAAMDIAPGVAERAANEYLQEEMPKILSEYAELFSTDISDESANDMANNQE